MTDWFLGLIPTYGPVLVGVVTFLSCLALPVPASLVMLTAGAFAAAGELGLLTVSGAALVGAVAGDQSGYWLGRRGGAAFVERASRRPARARLVARARDAVETHGIVGVFLSRWLVSPLGPYANLIGGSLGYPWAPFTIAAIAGEVVWVAVYVGLGFAFADNLAAGIEIAGTALAAVAAGLVALVIGRRLWRLAGARGERTR